MKSAAKHILGEVRVYLFGSIAEGRDTPSSDIDVMVVSSRIPETAGERARVVARMLEDIGLEAPLEIHTLRPGEEIWYLRFVKKGCRSR